MKKKPWKGATVDNLLHFFETSKVVKLENYIEPTINFLENNVKSCFERKEAYLLILRLARMTKLTDRKTQSK